MPDHRRLARLIPNDYFFLVVSCLSVVSCLCMVHSVVRAGAFFLLVSFPVCFLGYGRLRVGVGVLD